MGDDQLDVSALAGVDHGVGLLERAAEGLLEEDAGAVLGAGENHVVVTIEPAPKTGQFWNPQIGQAFEFGPGNGPLLGYQKSHG